MKKFLIVLAILLFVCVLLIFTVASKLRTNKPQNLGVSFTIEDLQRVDQKYGFKTIELADNQEIANSKSYEGSVAVEGTFTNAEISAQFDKWYKNWKYYPIKDVQFRVNSDGSIETTGVFIVDRTYPYFEYAGFSKDKVDQGLKYINMFGVDEIAFYITGEAKIVNNQISINLQKVKIGKFSIPHNLIEQYSDEVNQFAQSRIDGINNLDIEQMSFENAQTYAKGTFPKTTKAVK